MNFIIEFFAELYIEGTVGAAKSSKTPKVLRLFLLALMTSVMLMFFYLAYAERANKEIMVSFTGLGIVMSIFLMEIFVGMAKTKKRKSVG